MTDQAAIAPQAPAHTVEPVVVRLSDSVTLIHGDCGTLLPIECDAIISDPPYGIGYVHSGKGSPPIGRRIGAAKRHGQEWAKIVGDDKPFDPSNLLYAKQVILWGANNYAARLPQGVGRWLVWDKADGRYEVDSFGDAEIAWHNQGKACRIFPYAWKGVYCVKNGENNGRRYHPTQKPVGLMQWCIKQSKVPEGATVLDPYMGSGTTGIACIRTGRKFIGIEIDAGHFETARKRIEAELMQGTFDFSGGASAPTHNTRITDSGKV
jgi:DNA modification methylase